MYEVIYEKMFQNIIEKSKSIALSVKYNRAISIIHHLFTFSANFVSFIILLIGFIFANKYFQYRTIIIIISSLTTLSLLLASTFLKRRASFLVYINRIISNVNSNMARVKQENPFTIQLCLTLLLLYLPMCIMAIVIIISKSPWINVYAESQKIFIDSIGQVITFTAVIIPVQVALFTFIFAQLLGKYSSGIVRGLYSSPIILLLCSYPIISLLFLFFIHSYGYPENLKDKLIFFFASLDVICLFLMIWVATIGTQADKIIAYVGNRFSKKVKRKTKNAIVKLTTLDKLWTILGYFGFDWRDPDRMILFKSPPKSVAITNPLLTNLFNVANKAIVENQYEVFLAAIISIKKIIAAYVSKRSSYFGTSDSVISYTIDQMAALLSASSKSSNEYLITEVVRCIGDCAIISLQIDTVPKKNEPTVEERMSCGNHNIACSWMQLLEESFELSYTLTRSTAANESIKQLARIGAVAFQRGYGDVIFLGYLKWYSYGGHLEKSVIETKLLEVRYDNKEEELFEAI